MRNAAAEDFEWDGKIVVVGGVERDRAARQQSDLVIAVAEHAARLGGDADPQTLLEWVWRDFADGTLTGAAVPNDNGKFRRYVMADITQAMKSPRYRGFLRQYEKQIADEAAAVQARKDAKAKAEAEYKAKLDADISKVPTLYALMIERIEELEAQVAIARGRRVVGK